MQEPFGPIPGRSAARVTGWLLVIGVAILGAVAPAYLGRAMSDPAPSPLYQHSLRTSVDGMNTQAPPRPAYAAEAKLAAAKGTVAPQSAGTADGPVIVRDCFKSFGIFIMSPNPTDLSCSEGGTIQADGPTSVERVGPPYMTGTDIETEIIGMSLTGVSPFGPVNVRERLDMPSAGKVVNVVADGGGNFVSGNSFFDVFVEIELPGIGMVLNTGNQPVHVESGPISTLPPIGSTFSTPPSAPPVPLFDVVSGTLVGWLCTAAHTPTESEPCDSICWCIYRLTCATGNPDSLKAHNVPCVGGERIGSMCSCQIGTCAGSLSTRIGGGVPDVDAGHLRAFEPAADQRTVRRLYV